MRGDFLFGYKWSEGGHKPASGVSESYRGGQEKLSPFGLSWFRPSLGNCFGLRQHSVFGLGDFPAVDTVET